jgi:hypothetical protein
MKRILLSLMLLAAPLGAVNVSSNITLVHIADGFQWTTTFNIVNLDTAQASYTMYFYADDGTPLNLSIVGQAGLVPSVSGVLAVNGSAIIQTAGGPVLRQGWARLNSSQNLGAEATFVNHAAIANYEAAVPIGTVSNAFTIAFDNTNGFFTGVAIASTDQLNPAVVNASFRDSTGAQIATGQVAVLKAFGHISLLLNQSFPSTAGLTGTVEFDCVSFCSIGGLGLRFDPNGPFTSTTAFSR